MVSPLNPPNQNFNIGLLFERGQSVSGDIHKFIAESREVVGVFRHVLRVRMYVYIYIYMPAVEASVLHVNGLCMNECDNFVQVSHKQNGTEDTNAQSANE